MMSEQQSSQQQSGQPPLGKDQEKCELSSPRNEHISHPLLYDATPLTVLVDFEGKNDPYHPMNWPFQKKILTTFMYGLTSCWITFASAVLSSGLQKVAKEFDVTTETTAAGISLVVFGFGLGSIIWAPLSEVYGRKWVIVVVSTVSLRGRLFY